MRLELLCHTLLELEVVTQIKQANLFIFLRQVQQKIFDEAFQPELDKKTRKLTELKKLFNQRR